MKAIETIYNGFRFRSRLEARWAVFFDAADVSYIYEPEGFELADGSWYLPDFYLSSCNVWVEVKPDRADEQTVQLANGLSCGKGERVLVIQGTPDPENVDYDITLVEPHQRYNEEADMHFGECRRCSSLYLINGDIYIKGLALEAHEDGCTGKRGGLMADRIEKALQDARAARFEHGEAG